MRVKTKIFGSLQQYTKNKEMIFDIAEGKSIAAIKKIVGIPENVPAGIVVNGKLANENDIVKNNDEILFIMLVGGG